MTTADDCLVMGMGTGAVEGLAAAVPVEAPAEPDEIVIRPRPGWISIDWKELFQARELLYFLVWRDVTVRYKQTVLGAAWAVLQPLFMMVIFTVIFGRFAKIPSDGFPYPVFVLAGLLPWNYFAGAVTQAGQSLISQQNLLSKIYFPRLFIPTAAVGVFLVDLAISLGLYAVIFALYGVMPSRNVVFLPLLLVLNTLAILGLGCFLAALTVVYRDFKHVVPFLIQVMMYLSPVIYPISLLPARYRLVLALNPMAGIIAGYRSAFLGTPWDFAMLGISTAVTLILFVFGLYYFRKTERRFADIA